MDRCESAFYSVANIEFRPNYPRIFPLTFSRWLEKIALHDNRSLRWQRWNPSTLNALVIVRLGKANKVSKSYAH
jgi:hypothetical protein